MSYVFLDVRIGSSSSNRIIIELFEKDAPETCLFFKSIVNHPNGYKGTRFHRVIEEFMIQGGEIDLENDDAPGPAPDVMENVDHPVDKPGLVGLARSSARENTSQFFITLVAAEHLQGVHTIFGRVVKGLEWVEKISKVEVDDVDNPTPGNEVVIVNCGELQPRKTLDEQPATTPLERSHIRSENGHGRREERSRSPREERGYRRRSRSRERRYSDARPRSPPPDDEIATSPREEQSHRHHHRHHRHRDQSPRQEEEVDDSRDYRRRQSDAAEDEEPTRDKTRSHKRSREDRPPTAPRNHTNYKDYKWMPRHRQENNYGRLGYDASIDDVREDEYQLRDAEREREGGRRVEPTIIFKGRGVMKYRDRNY